MEVKSSHVSSHTFALFMHLLKDEQGQKDLHICELCCECRRKIGTVQEVAHKNLHIYAYSL